jgi:hypothetical protein
VKAVGGCLGLGGDQTNSGGMAGAGTRRLAGITLPGALGHDPPAVIAKAIFAQYAAMRPLRITERRLSRSGEIVAKSGELRNAADDPIEARDRNLQERGGGGRIALGEI